MTDDAKANYIVEISTEILQAMEESGIDSGMAWAILGNAFSRMSKGLGYDAEGFRKICNEMADIYD